MDDLQLSPEESMRLRELMAQARSAGGVERREWIISGIEPRGTAMIRVHASIEGTDSLEHWAGPNPVVRFALPNEDEEFSDLTYIPGTTSRVYTIAEVDVARRQVAVDIVVHEGSSPAMRWLASVKEGDRLTVTGPKAHRLPGEGEMRYLFADLSGLPAALNLVRTMPGSPFELVVAMPEDHAPHLLPPELLTCGADGVSVTVVPDVGEEPLASHAATLGITKRDSVWGAGERQDMKRLRRMCKDLGLPKEAIQVFGYWRTGLTGSTIDVIRLRAAAAGKAVDDLDLDY